VPDGHILITEHFDKPGMIGKIGTVLGERGINIAATAVGRAPDHEQNGSQAGLRSSPAGGGTGRLAVMVVTTDSPVPEDVIREIVSIEGFHDGRAVTL
jgi:D-3-phosphoglycerate dehydrogenase / 2-oxoglutarate reductase